MAFFSTEQKWVGVGKETTRGTAVTPSLFLPVGRESNADYKLNLIEDELVRGIFEKFPPKAGRKDGTFALSNIEVNSSNLGLFLLSLLGSVNTQDIGGAGNAYQHIFTRNSNISLPSLTLTIHRGISAKQYPLSVVKSIAFSQGTDNQLLASINGLFKTETELSNPPTPTWQDQASFMFYQNTFKLGGVIQNNVKEWNITIDNGTIPIKLLNLSQDVNDFVSHSKLLASGSFVIYFEDENERSKFLNNTSTNLEILYEGATIEGSYKHTFKIELPQIHYTAFPFSDVDGLLGATVSFNAYYKLSTSESAVKITLINTTSSY